jgi:molecular chaperone HtpG
MSALSGGGYGTMPESYKLVLNVNHPLIGKINDGLQNKMGEELSQLNSSISELNQEINVLDSAQKDKKAEEISQDEKDKLKELQDKLSLLNKDSDNKLKDFGKNTKIVKQLIDLALLSNNMLKGEALNIFVKRSIDIIED